MARSDRSRRKRKGVRMNKRWLGLLALAVTGLLLTGCGGSKKSSGGGKTGEGKTAKVTLQLKWVTQAQFAGYYAAKAKGYYKDEGLDVNIKIGGPGIPPGPGGVGQQAGSGLHSAPGRPGSRAP